MPLTIHVGLPKTATKTLQGTFFDNHKEIFCIRRKLSNLEPPTYFNNVDVEIALNHLIRKVDVYEPNEAIRSLVKNAGTGNKKVVFSFEDISILCGASPFEKIQRIKDQFDDCAPIKIIMCIRNQVDFLKSFYVSIHSDVISGRASRWWPDFDSYVEIIFNYTFNAFPEYFKFCQVADRYKQIVGENNVLILNFADFCRDQRSVLQKICNFMDIDDSDPCIDETIKTRANERISNRADFLRSYRKIRQTVLGDRTLQRVIPQKMRDRFYSWFNRGSPFEVKPSLQSIRRIEDFYRADNENLAKKYGILL